MPLEAHSPDLETHPDLETQQLGGSLLVLCLLLDSKALRLSIPSIEGRRRGPGDPHERMGRK